MSIKIRSNDPDIIGSLPAMRRAAKRARRVAMASGTPLVLWRDGTIVHVDPSAKPTVKRTGTKKKAG